LLCTVGASSPLVASKRNLAAGSYRVVAESLNADPVQLTAFVRPAVPPTQVLFADTCDDPFPIPPEGGFFQGNTANALADYSAGCDQDNGDPNGAPEQILELTLTETKRVIFDMTDSGYSTLLDVRMGPTCPGEEVMYGCTIGYLGT